MHCWSLRTPHARGLRARVGSQAAASAKGSGRRRACRCGKREVVAAAVMAGSLLFSVSCAGSQNKTPRQQGNLPNLPVVGVSGAWLDSYQDELAAGVSFSQLVQDAVARCKAGTLLSGSLDEREMCRVWRERWAASTSYVVVEAAELNAPLTLGTLFTVPGRGSAEVCLLAVCCITVLLGTWPGAELLGTSSRQAPLECPICMGCMDSKRHVPRIMDCGHTACQGCYARMLRPIVAKGGVKELECPECRTTTAVPNGQADELPKNFALLR